MTLLLLTSGLSLRSFTNPFVRLKPIKINKDLRFYCEVSLAEQVLRANQGNG